MSNPIIVALDVPNVDKALALAGCRGAVDAHRLVENVLSLRLYEKGQ